MVSPANHLARRWRN